MLLLQLSWTDADYLNQGLESQDLVPVEYSIAAGLRQPPQQAKISEYVPEAAEQDHGYMAEVGEPSYCE